MISTGTDSRSSLISPHVLEERIPHDLYAKRPGFQGPEETISHEEIETLNVLVNDGSSVGAYTLDLIVPPKLTTEITQLQTLKPKLFLRDLRSDKVEQICILITEDDYVADIRSVTVFTENERVLSSSSMDELLLDEKTRIERYTPQYRESLQANPLYKNLIKFRDVFPDFVPCELPKYKGTRHEIELKSGSKNCVMKQCPLPREQVLEIDKFFADRFSAGHVRESTFPHSSPTFCVRKATGGWRIVNAATVPAQTPIPRKDVIINGMSRSTIFSSMYLIDGFYQILMRERDIPYTAVSTPSAHKNTGILVFVDRFSNMMHLASVPESITAQGCSRFFIDTVFRLHDLPRELVSDRDPRSTAEFWQSVFRSLGTRLKMSTSDHPETDG